MQLFPLVHILSQFLLQIIVLLHGGAEKLVVAIELLGRKKLSQNGDSGFMQLDLSLELFDPLFGLLDLVWIDPLFFQPRLNVRLICRDGALPGGDFQAVRLALFPAPPS